MELKKIYISLLKEEMGNSKPVLEMPDVNMKVSFFPFKKMIVFSPQDHFSTTEKIKEYLDLIQKNFRISNLTEDKGSFEIVFDPRENFSNIVEFMNQFGSQENEND